MTLLLPPPSTPITEALDQLVGNKALTATERDALTPAPVGVRTLGDLVTILGRGEIEDTKLAEKLKKVLGV